MIIDCHGHFTTVPASFRQWRAKQIEFANDPAGAPSRAEAHVSDDQIREAIETGQLKLQRERGSDLTLFSPIAGLMSHHLGNERTSLEWAELSNDLVYRVTTLYPENFAPVCQLPQSPGVDAEGCIPELRRCVEQLGFVGCNLNPDPTGGYWTGKPMTDREWYPLYEALVDLDVPAMIHVAASCNPCFHGTGAHYLNADTSVFMQLLQSDLFKDFPTLRFVIPHGGGAVPYHWGRYRGMSLEMRERPLEGLLDNVFFDSCVYHQPGVELLTKVVPVDNVLFGSEMIGAVRGKDPSTGQYFDDTKRYIDACPALTSDDRFKIFEGNARRVYPRLDARLKAQGK
ncbi:amidohydrolase family protein [Trinickia caryophylli]|uniref:4-oxalomesaconate hydratase n=1 Tax=Trinickia caryophylli TaxID=28094 RepID=A0A1X7EAQ8_TRICW|nr:amidohydrolase family protein [Trinickia caryophylli]PMS12996.1 amidohydrolase [Trinickia caryophylli]TRX14755.1 amidohydrolase [Trinickia caryophylli]WQE14602.1 amidohydrolase family protein [Trinickia caryophylli]SMF30167.1 4-oxalomesaconate hydratase [Trinickia caryophylli]GLU31983.1 4-oxalomesaconate hydratase [Trinickia caryophylli]